MVGASTPSNNQGVREEEGEVSRGEGITEGFDRAILLSLGERDISRVASDEHPSHADSGAQYIHERVSSSTDVGSHSVKRENERETRDKGEVKRS
jgi:hypothetical protein